MVRRLCLLVLCCIVPVTARDLSLETALETALLNNYSVQLEKADHRIAAMNNSWGQAGRFPTIDLDLVGSERLTRIEDSETEQQSLTGSVSLNWLLFDGFAIQIRKSRLEDLEELSAGNTALVIENTVESVILGYFNCLLQREKAEIAEEVMDLSRDRYDFEQERHRLGSQSRYELLQAQNAFLEDKARYLQQYNQFRNSIRDLYFLMGAEDSLNVVFTTPFQVQPRDYSLQASRERMVANNRTLKNQYIHQSLLEKQVRLEQSEWWPSLSARAGVETGRNRSDAATNMFTTSDQSNAFASLTLRWNLFNGGNRSRAIEIARVEREAGNISIASMKHSLTNRLYNLFETYQVRKQLLEVARESLSAAQLNLEISEEKFDTGAINSFNYRDVQLIYLNAALNRLNAVYDLIEVDHALLKITGGILSEYESASNLK